MLTHGHEQLTRKLGALANSLLQGQEAGETVFSIVFTEAWPAHQLGGKLGVSALVRRSLQ